MFVVLLLMVIYLAFISLGLPDALLGSAWPTMQLDIGVPISYMGVISMIVSFGTIISSLFTDKLVRKLKTAIVTTVSVFMTAIALFGFAFSSHFWQLCLWAIVSGLGAGCVDAVLNNFVAINYQARHMSWLHCFWGVGAAIGPYVMGLCLTAGYSWNTGYNVIGVAQMVLVGVLLLSFPLWKKQEQANSVINMEQKSLSLSQTMALPGAKMVMLTFFAYCSVEATAGLWSSSYFVIVHNISAELAAKWSSVFYIGITIGRFLSGFVSNWFGDKFMVRLGEGVIMVGVALLIVPSSAYVALAGLLLVGLGGAPIFPSLIHQTPDNFGNDKSQSIIGVQMASAYSGSTFTPLIFGFIAEKINIQWFSIYLLVFMVITIVANEKVNKIRAART